MHDILVTIGITLLLFLIMAVTLLLWLFWSTRPLAPVTEREYKQLTDEINRLKAEEEELRAKVDKEWERHAKWDALAINNDLNERTKR